MKLVGLRLLVGLLFCGISAPTLAQNDMPPIEFTAGLSYRNFEWVPEGKWDIHSFQPIVNFGLSARIRPQLDMTLQGGGNLLDLSENHPSTANSEIDWMLKYSPFKNMGNETHRLLNPYLLGGMGSTLRGKGPRELNFHIPLGVGLAIRPTPRSVVQIQALYKLSEIQDYVALTGAVGLRLGKSAPKDKDQDGIPDKEDRCPLVPGLIAFQGCADTDEDGVPDGEDPCPLVAGLLEDMGCPPPPPDTDEDGIPDSQDACPMKAGPSQTGGCPDNDGDGIPDKNDECPQLAGRASTKGCPDSDNDGVPDKMDACPEAIGDFTTQGCPDADLDGVRDKDDECPVDAGPIENKGCPLIKSRGAEELEFYAQYVKFEHGSTQLSESSQKILQEVAHILLTYSSFSMEISGHTDSSGEEEKNITLSLIRAEVCREFLIQQGVSPDKLLAVGRGEAEPIASNETPEGREQNRRVEFSLRSN